MNKYLMTNMTWKEYEVKKDRILILPIGSTEQHGPHLPLSVDAVIAEKIALKFAEKVDGIVAPTLSYGYKSKPLSGGGPLFPGTIDLNGITVMNLVCDLLEEFIKDGITKIFILNAHFENEAFILESVDLVSNQTGGMFYPRTPSTKYFLRLLFPDGHLNTPQLPKLP